MTKDLSRAGLLLVAAAAAQTAFWDAVSALEAELGSDVDSSLDLQDQTVASLLDPMKEV